MAKLGKRNATQYYKITLNQKNGNPFCHVCMRTDATGTAEVCRAVYAYITGLGWTDENLVGWELLTKQEYAKQNPWYKSEQLDAILANKGFAALAVRTWYKKVGDCFVPRIMYLPLTIVECLPHGEHGAWARLWYKAYDTVWLPR